MSEPIFEIKNIQFAYPESSWPLFENFSLKLSRKSALSILGPSGSGKSTLLKLIFGVLSASKGSLHLSAKNPMYLGQEESLIPWKSVMYNLLLPYKLNTEKVNTQILSDAHILLEQVGLLSYQKRRVCQLSVGMRKRLELARCLLKKPDFLLMDEPFAALDPAHREAMLLLAKNLEKKYGFASVFVTHNIEDGVFWGEKVIVLGSKNPTQILYEQTLEKSSNSIFKLNLIEEKSHDDIRAIFFESQKEDLSHPPVRRPIPQPRKLDIWQKLSPLVVFSFVLCTLSLGKYLGKWPDYLIPWPTQVLSLFIETLANHSIFPHLQETIYISMMGFVSSVIFSLPSGYFLAHFSLFRNIFLPFIILFNTIPMIALAPFLLLWIGISPLTKIIITILVITFPLLLTTQQAFHIGQEQTQLHRAYLPGKKLSLFIHLEWRYALPILLVGWKTALGTSVIGTVIAEFIIGKNGLGALINLAKSRFDTPLMFVGLIWLVIMGFLYFQFFSLIQKIYQRSTFS
ncbi:MAG: ATP-binding cassette domain-containing protein [Spirochaetia bacterium]